MTEIFKGNFQIVWNSTSLGALKDCPRKYYYSIICGWSTGGENIHIIFGLAYHKAVELYHFAKAKGQSHESALAVAVRSALEATYPDTLLDSKKSRWNLIRTIVWYLDQFGPDDPIKTLILNSGEPAVEVTFAHHLDIPSPTGDPYILAGHIDRIGEFAGPLYYTDLKTTGAALGDFYFENYSPNNQMSVYSYAGQIITDVPLKGGIIDAAQILVSGSRFQRGFVNRTPDQLLEWRDDLAYWLGMAQSFASREHWPMNDQACRLCNFKKICASDPKVRESFLRSNFTHRVINPLEIRT